jgi:hypothetical protein
MSNPSEDSGTNEFEVSPKEGIRVKAGSRTVSVKDKTILHRSILGKPTSLTIDDEHGTAFILFDEGGKFKNGFFYNKKTHRVEKLTLDPGDESGKQL